MAEALLTRMLTVGALALAGAALGACAGGASQADRAGSAAAARGEALSKRVCAKCHGVGASDPSTFPGALPLRDLKMDYNAISYERRLAQLHVGRVGMPPAQVSLAEVADIVAYIRTLNPDPPQK